MKKIFTLLFAVGTFSLAQAQSDYRDNRQMDQKNFNSGKDSYASNNFYNKDGRYDKNDFSFDRGREIERINREYDERIERVKHNFFLGWNAKQRQISFLQEQRQRKIRMVLDRDHDRRDRYNDRDRKNW